ncbi:MAG: hypothetical protein C4K60_19165 [Ideonella sp. MAG2]|nr:MAG: hypothetical protein C4K60_19165 [Ideonella sp. MAG2]
MPLLNSILRRAIELMRDKPLAHKLGALVVALAVPLLVLLALQWREHQRLIDTSEREYAGLALVQRVAELAVQLESVRGAMAVASLQDHASAPAAQAELSAQLQALKEGVGVLQKTVSGAGMPELSQDLEIALRPVMKLGEDPPTREQRAYDAAHSRAAAALMEFNLRVAERAGLLMEADAQAYFLTDLVVERVPSLIETAGRAHAATMAVLARGDASSTDRARVMALSQRTRDGLLHLRGRLEALKRSGGELPGQWSDSYRQIDDAAQFSRLALEAEAIAADVGEASAVGARARRAALLLHAELMGDLRSHLMQRINTERQAQLIAVLLVGTALLLAGGIAWLFFRSFVGSTMALVKSLEQASRGNLASPVHIRGRDEVAHMGALVEQMCRNMSALVADIRTSATRLGEAGQTVASEGVSLAHRTDAQAHSLRQSVDVMEQLVGQVATTADGINRISELTATLHQQSKEGTTAMMATVQSMDCLQASAKRVAEINGVIDDISFQTNLVALNASVEAAKAGESGRGFSVVAAEIRQLAQRCAAAAAEVRELIDTTNNQVESTSLQIQSVGGALIGLQTGVEKVLERLQSVSQASAEQSAGLEQVSAEIISLQGLTQEGAAAVERCEAAAASLLGQAASLSRSVKPVKLREGSADEAKAMVLHARELVAAVGWENAAQEFNEVDGPWHDRGMYIFAWDGEGVCLAYGVKPQWVGRNIYEFPNGSVDMVEDFLHKAFAILNQAEQEGWIDYRQLDANTMVPVAKSAYIVGLAGGGFMGCSVVRQAADGELDKPCADLSVPMTPAQADALCASCDQADTCAAADASTRVTASERSPETV